LAGWEANLWFDDAQRLSVFNQAAKLAWRVCAAEGAALVWWFATLAGATCAFKLYALQSRYQDGVWGLIDGEAAGLLGGGVNLLLILSCDLVQVSLLVAVAYLVCRLVPRLSFNLLMLVTALSWLALNAANQLSHRELGTGLTFEILRVAVNWTFSDPAIVLTYASKQAILAFVMILAWCAVPFFISFSIRTARDGRLRLQRFWTACALASFFLVALGALALADPEFALTWWWLYLAGFAAVFAAPYYLRLPIPWAVLGTGLQRVGLGLAVVILIVSGAVQTARMLETQAETPPAYEGHIPLLVGALFADQDRGYREVPAPSLEDLRAGYWAVTHPPGAGPLGGPLVDLPAARLHPRHILIIGLETAPQRFYTLHGDPTLPNLFRMGQQAVVSTMHNTTAPTTSGSGASILSGLYTVAVATEERERLRPDSLPVVLAQRGYESTYIDSFLVDFGVGNSEVGMMYRGLGVDHLFDSSDVPGFDHLDKAFEVRSRLEEVSFDRAWGQIRDAEARGEHALVYLMTALGHFPWRPAAGHENDPPRARFHGILEAVDRLLGTMLERLEQAGLSDEVLVVVTGDHGLRFGSEFESLGLPVGHSDALFNVPLLVYAPGLLDRTVEVPFVTSHVDLAPTVLAMLGIPAEGLFHHGANILDGTAANRVTFMFTTGFSPIDGYHWNGRYFTYDQLRGVAQVANDPARTDAVALEKALSGGAEIPDTLARPDALVEAARGVLDQTIAYFLNRKAQATVAQQ